MGTKIKPATPLPWKVSGLGYISAGNKVLARTETAPARYQQRIDLPIEDALYLVRAANAYPKLVGALRAIESKSIGGKPETPRAIASELLRDLGEAE
jgi:hypothetical protein